MSERRKEYAVAKISPVELTDRELLRQSIIASRELQVEIAKRIKWCYRCGSTGHTTGDCKESDIE